MQEFRHRRNLGRGVLDWRLAPPWLLLVGSLGAAAWGILSGWPVGAVVVFLLLSVASVWQCAWTKPQQTAAEYSSSQPGYWQDWLSGWYWQTDEQHRLVLLKPDTPDTQAWLSAHSLTQREAPVWSLLSEPGMPGRPALTEAEQGLVAMLQTRLAAGLPVELSDLPLPTGLHGGAGARLNVRGAPRFDNQGRFQGHHGVWELSMSTGSDCPPEGRADDAGGTTGKTEPDQEVLRYALSHDLRAPLRVVDGFARILKEDYGRVLDRIGNDHLDRVLAAAARMNGMIDAILEQAHLSQAPLQRCRIDLSALAHEVAEEQSLALQGQLGPDGGPVRIEWRITGGLITEADPALVRRVLDNLIGNALKYSGKVAHPRIEVGAVPATDPRVYFVRDNGAGFDMQHADKLFGLFQRLHSTKEFPGTGVGLAGVQNIVRRHGGRVWAEAVPGEGACFYFTLTSNVKSSVQGPQA